MKSDLTYITRKKISNFYEYMFKCKEKDVGSIIEERKIGCIISYFSGNVYYYVPDLWGILASTNYNTLCQKITKEFNKSRRPYI